MQLERVKKLCEMPLRIRWLDTASVVGRCVVGNELNQSSAESDRGGFRKQSLEMLAGQEEEEERWKLKLTL